MIKMRPVTKSYNTLVLKIMIVIALSMASVFSRAQLTGIRAKKAILMSVIDTVINGEIAAGKIPGAVIQIKQGDEIVYTRAYGDAQKFNYNH